MVSLFWAYRNRRASQASVGRRESWETIWGGEIQKHAGDVWIELCDRILIRNLQSKSDT